MLYFTVPTSLTAEDNSKSAWQSLSEGLELGRFKVDRASPVGDSVITVVRIDPAHFEIGLFSSDNIPDKKSRSTRRWCREHGLTAAINAGMYDINRVTHIGYMKIGEYVNNPLMISKDYRSAAAFYPVSDSLPPFRMFDLDETAMDSVTDNYHHVIQNIRLIKRPGENRWPVKKEKWSEAALGEDIHGNVLFIFCRSLYTMYDFNELLLSLPIDIVCTQHLEGGPEAQMYLNTGDTEIDLCGSFETKFFESNTSRSFLPIPNIIGVKPRADKP